LLADPGLQKTINKAANKRWKSGAARVCDGGEMDELNHDNADQFFISVFRALRPFAGYVIG
ncbi:MAG: hypothetical protein V7776_23980, partial [Halopseudomonas aestusnigri]